MSLPVLCTSYPKVSPHLLLLRAAKPFLFNPLMSCIGATLML